MKQLLILCNTLVACFFISQQVMAQGDVMLKDAKKPGKYRQLFFLPQAYTTSGGMHRIDTTIVLNTEIINTITVSVMGARGGDEFAVFICNPDSMRRIIFHQTFFMNGWKSESLLLNNWFSNSGIKIHKELGKFFKIYFGITILNRKDFLESLRAGDF